MPTQSICPAGLNGRHNFELPKADVPGIGFAPCRTELAEYIGDFQLVPRHYCAGLFQSAF